MVARARARSLFARILKMMTPELTRLRGIDSKSEASFFRNFGQILEVFRSIFRPDFGVRLSRAYSHSATLWPSFLSPLQGVLQKNILLGAL